jgi:acyl dehydratase
MSAQKKWYFDDFVVGQTVEVGSRSVSEEEIITFAKQFDPQPFHVDKDAAAHSIFGGIIASGWHTCSMIMRLMVDGFLADSTSLGSPGVDEVRWIKPVRGGDTLTVTTTILDVKPSTSKADRGVVWTEWRAVNQHGELVATIKGMGMFLKRHGIPHA